ncbi:TPA: glycosyl hydrolase family 26, partial [Vibrio cholerae]
MKKQYLTLITLLLLNGCTGNDEERMNIREQVSTVSITIDNEGEKPPVLYTANINSKTIFCGGQINGMEQLDNLGSDSGTFSSGFNATAFLQPGENELNLWTVPVGAYNGDFTYHENDRCELTIFGAFPDGNKQEL